MSNKISLPNLEELRRHCKDIYKEQIGNDWEIDEENIAKCVRLSKIHCKNRNKATKLLKQLILLSKKQEQLCRELYELSEEEDFDTWATWPLCRTNQNVKRDSEKQTLEYQTLLMLITNTGRFRVGGRASGTAGKADKQEALASSSDPSAAQVSMPGPRDGQGSNTERSASQEQPQNARKPLTLFIEILVYGSSLNSIHSKIASLVFPKNIGESPHAGYRLIAAICILAEADMAGHVKQDGSFSGDWQGKSTGQIIKSETSRVEKIVVRNHVRYMKQWDRWPPV